MYIVRGIFKLIEKKYKNMHLKFPKRTEMGTGSPMVIINVNLLIFVIKF